MAERVCCSYQNVLSIQNRVCCLYRVSTTKQVDHDDQNQADIPVQRKACREFAERMGWTIVYEEQENGVSGFKVSANDRDKIQLIKEYAEQGKFDILLVFMFDRIGRRAEETPFVVEWLINHGIQVWSVNEGEQRIDTHVDRLTNYIRFWQADGESQKTSMRTKAALGQMVQEGRFRGGSAPYGYDLVPSGTYNKRKHEVFKLEINPDEAKVVRMMFDLCVGSGYGRFKIANFLSEMGIKTRDGKNWHEAKAAKEYESLKLEIIKAVQGESTFPMDVLSELVNNARTRMLDANAQLTELNEEVEKSNQRIEAIKADYRRIMKWSEMFDGSDMDVKRMIAGYIIKRVDVYSDYRLHIEFNMSFAQFELGLETEVEYAAQDIVS